MDWQIFPFDGLTGTVAVPGSKSHTIRGVVAALLSSGTSSLYAPLISEDTVSCCNAAAALGANICKKDAFWQITGCGGVFTSPDKVIDMGNSGTSLRIITAAAALGREKITFDGDDSLRTRIMNGELSALTALGASAESRGGFAPLSVCGPLRGGKTKVDGTTSQYLSALLMALPLAEGDSELELDFLNEADYVRITLDWLKRCGIKVAYSEDLLHFEIPGNQSYRNFERVIPADFSTAAFPLAAGVIAGAKVSIANLDFCDLQGDKKVFDFVREMGGIMENEANCITVRKSQLTGKSFDLNSTPDALPVMAVLGCYASGKTELLNVPQARLKETDRIDCMCRQLRKMGAEIEELPDGMIIYGGKKLHGAVVDGCKDHRIAMALSVAALGAEGETVVLGGEACEVTYPNFAADFTAMGMKIIQE